MTPKATPSRPKFPNFPYLLAYALILLTEYSKADKACSLSIQQDPHESDELILVKSKSPLDFVYPSALTPSVVQIEEGDHIRLICGSHSQLVGCQKKQLWKDDKNTPLVALTCNQKPLKYTSVAALKSSSACPASTECMRIGFPINLFDFAATIDLIHLRTDRKRVIWAHAVLIPIINVDHQHDETSNPRFESCDSFQGLQVSMDEIYNKDYQRQQLGRIFQDDESADLYISDKGDTIFQPGGEYFVRGLLIHNRDFFYKPQQSTVYHYANVVPVWKSVAENNWYLSGRIIRKIASNTKSSLQLWSGSIGTLQLEDIRNVKRNINLAMDDSGNDTLMPVPKILFKCVYKPSSNQGIAILTVNNPYLRKLSSDYVLCSEQSICQVLYSRFRIFAFGYTYCCSLKDFAAIAKSRGMPSFPFARPLFQAI